MLPKGKELLRPFRLMHDRFMTNEVQETLASLALLNNLKFIYSNVQNIGNLYSCHANLEFSFTLPRIYNL